MLQNAKLARQALQHRASNIETCGIGQLKGLCVYSTMGLAYWQVSVKQHRARQLEAKLKAGASVKITHLSATSSNPAWLLKNSVREVLRLNKQPLVAIGITEAGILHSLNICDLTGRLDALCF